MTEMVLDLGGLDWQERAACAGADTEEFYPEKGGNSGAAKRICNGTEDQPACPVRMECLHWAIEHKERDGIWGGMSEMERRSYARGESRIPSPRSDLVGMRFGSWTVLAPAAPRANGHMWWCLCDCGRKREVQSNALRYGRTSQCKSCAASTARRGAA